MKRRYPGLKSFDESESLVFFGRESEISELSDLILSNKTVLLYSKSGIGKTSLIKAGVFPTLELDKYLCIPIRFYHYTTERDFTPVDILKKQVIEECAKKNIQISDSENKDIWELLKSIEVLGRETILFFDQFEELFLFNESEINQFALVLSELLSDKLPVRIQSKLTTIAIEHRTENILNDFIQVKIKIAFIIRSDKLNELHKIKSLIPSIKLNEYVLTPLSIDRAKEALVYPSQKAGSFTSPKFKIENDVIELIIEKLLGSNKIIDSTQLQIIGSFIEDLAIKKFNNGEIDPSIQSTDLSEDQINNIIVDFYHNQLNSFDTYEDIQRIKFVLESHLVSNGTRASLTEKQICTYLPIETIDKLVDLRILKQEFTHLGSTYELSHDTLVYPVEKEKRIRFQILKRERQIQNQENELKEKEKSIRARNIFLILSSILLIGLIVFIYLFFKYDRITDSTSDFKKDLISTLNEGGEPCETVLNNGILFFKEGKYLDASIYFANAKFLYDDSKKYKLNRASLNDIIELSKKGNEANLLFNEGELQKAILLYKEIYDFEKSNKDFFEKNSYCYSQIQNSKYAIEIFENFEKNNPNPEKVYHLNLASKNLYTLPIEFRKYYNLKTLSLRDNKITKIPKVVYLFSNLVGLNLNENKITEIDTQLTILNNLTDLSLNNNNIKEIPVEVLNFKNLKYLVLKGNNVRFLRGFKDLKNLETLVIDNNPVEEIDSTFYKISGAKIQAKGTPFLKN